MVAITAANVIKGVVSIHENLLHSVKEAGSPVERGLRVRLHPPWVDDDWRLSSEDTTSGPTPALLAGDSHGGASALLEDFELHNFEPNELGASARASHWL